MWNAMEHSLFTDPLFLSFVVRDRRALLRKYKSQGIYLPQVQRRKEKNQCKGQMERSLRHLLFI